VALDDDGDPDPPVVLVYKLETGGHPKTFEEFVAKTAN
jgi:hypothetical protein